MMNLFGIPVSDDIVAAFLAAPADKRQEGAKKAFKFEDSFGKKESLDVETKARRSAETAKKFFDAYMEQGFTRGEAIKLTIANLNTKF